MDEKVQKVEITNESVKDLDKTVGILKSGPFKIAMWMIAIGLFLGALLSHL